MKINSVTSNLLTTMFSHMNSSTSLLSSIDLKEYHNIKTGTYHRALVQYYKNYNKDGTLKEDSKTSEFQSKLDLLV